MPSISSQSLFSSVTTEFAVRKIQAIDPKRFNQTLFQMSDQQSRDKSYEKGLEYLRTYIASLQAKANSLIEELNSIYENMLSDTLFRRADTKDTAQLLNRLPNADQDSCSALANTYNPKDLEITPYDQNVRYYSYNPLFGSRALDMQNYYNESQNTDTSIARAYYESTDGSLHHELGASAFSTLSYLWMWDLDRINATYATTKDAYLDESGVLHVRPGDARATVESVNAGIIVEDPLLAIAGSGDPNRLQVNVTALQPNRQVFFPDDNTSVTEVDLLKTTVEESQPLAGWITLSDFSGSQYTLDVNPTSGNATKQYLNSNVTNLDPYWQNLMQWGVDDTDMISNNPVPAGVAPLYNEDTSGYNSRHSFQFGNTMIVTYGGVTYAPHSNYIFEPEVVNETFDAPLTAALSPVHTKQDTWSIDAGGDTSLIGNDGAAGNNTITGDGDFPDGTTTPTGPGANNYLFHDPTGLSPQDNLNLSYYWNASSVLASEDLTIRTPTFNLTDFEDIEMKVKSFYRVAPYGQKKIIDYRDSDYAFDDYDLVISEISRPSVTLNLTESATSTVVLQTTAAATSGEQQTHFGVQIDPSPTTFFHAPAPLTNGQFTEYSTNIAKGTNNMGLVINIDELAPNDFSSLPPINPNKGVYLSAVDFRRGIQVNNPNTDYIYNNNISGSPNTPPVLPAISYTGTAVADYATSTTWQIDDLYMNATGFSRGELISPEVDFTNMESGWLEFYDRIETNPLNTIEKKQVWYSFDYDEINKTGTWQLLLDKPEAEQAWGGNKVEIPCSGDQPKVRVKFVFDTRKVVSQRSTLGGNFQRDTGYDGWNIDDIRLFGVKVDPTDFYYYRQDLDSEFVTGTGPRVNTSSVSLPGLQGINPTATRTDTDPTKLTNTFVSSGSAADSVDFIIPNTISTVTTTSDVSFNVDAPDNSDALGTVSETTTMPPGNIYPAVTITGYFDDSGSDYNFDGFNEGLISFANPYLAPPLSVGEKVTIQGYTYDVLAVSGNDAYLDVAHAFRITPPTPNVYRDLSMLGIVNSETPAVISSRAPVTLTNPRNLYWDITGVPNPQAAVLTGSLRFDSYRVNDVAYTPPAPLPPGIQENDNYAYYANINGIRVDPNINATAKNFPIVMGFMPGITFNSTDAPISTIDVSNINLSPTAAAVQITFDHSGTNSSLSTVRTLEILDSGGSPVSSARSYPILSDTPTAVPPINLNSTEIAALQGGGKIRFTATTSDGLRVSATPDEEIWSVSSLKIKEVDSPPTESYTSELETGLYNITQSNTKFSFDYSAVDDLSGAISDVDRKVYMYSSTDGFTTPIEILNVSVQTGNVPTFVSTGPIGMATGTTVKFKFVTEIEVPSNVTVAPRSNLFEVQNLQMSRYEGDGYNLSESPNAPYDAQRPNISFDARRTNLQGKYTVVNSRNQISNTDYPMFSNAFLTYVEQDASLTNNKLTDTYVDWKGENDSPPARVVDAITGKVKSQTKGNFIQRDDGLSQMYDTTSSGGIQDFFVDDAMAINTGRLTKPTSLDDINKNKTGWVNAQDLDGGGGSKIWLPYIPGTKYDEFNGTYKSQTIWGKRSFLTDAVNTNAQLTISSNDDAFLYVNGYNVKSTSYSQVGSGAGALVDMIDASDYSVGEYIMIKGEIIRIQNKIGPGNNTLVLNGGTNFGLGTFDDSTAGQPATVYHVDLPLDLGGNAITVVGTTSPNKIELSSLNGINIGQTITINGENYKITSTNSDNNVATLIIDVTPANLASNPIPNNSIVYFGTSDKGPASNPLAPGTGTNINTDLMSPAITYNIAPLLRTGFNTIGFKASEDRGTGEGVSITSSNITAIGDTSGPNGINTDSRWAVKIQEKGYDGVVPVGTSTANPYSNSLSNPEIVELFKSEQSSKKELTVKFINQDQFGNGRLSHIQSIDVTVTGEPLIGTFKTTNYSTETFIDGLVTTQLEKGYIRGVAQEGNGAALVFDPTNASDPDNPTSAPANLTTGLRYTTGTDGLADINVFLEKDDNIVNDATLMVKVDYYEDANGDGLIDGDTNENGLIDNGETGILKTKYIGMQDLRANLPSNPKGNSAGGAITNGTNSIVDRYKYAEANIVGGIALGGTVLTVPVADISKFNIGDDIKIINGVNNQTVMITNVNTGTGQITFQPYTGTGLGFATAGITTVSTNKALSDVDPNYAIRMYSGSDKFNIGANTTVHSMNVTATNGRSGGADVTGNQNKLTQRLKTVLDNAEYADVIKYGLLDELYIAATASDNRGDQVVGKILLTWDWQRKRLGMTQGSFSAVYKS